MHSKFLGEINYTVECRHISMDESWHMNTHTESNPAHVGVLKRVRGPHADSGFTYVEFQQRVVPPQP